MSKLGGGPGITSASILGDVKIRAPTGPFLITNYTVTDVASEPIAVPLTDRVSIGITNESGTITIYFGNSDVTDTGATKGRRIGPNEDFNIDLDDSGTFYLVAPSGQTAAVNIIEIAST